MVHSAFSVTVLAVKHEFSLVPSTEGPRVVSVMSKQGFKLAYQS